MLFNSFQYLTFLTAVVAIFWLLPRKARPLLLVVASYYFYMSWLKSYGLLLGGLTAANYGLGLAIARLRTEKNKRLALIAGLALNLGCLALYKYTDFLITSVWELAQKMNGQIFAQLSIHLPNLNLSDPAPTLGVLLPLGISFFAFEFIHYLTDVFKGSPAIVNPVRFALFAAFFPSQIAGPIKRYQDFDHQLDEEQKFSFATFEAGMWLILRGMFKKVALGDNLAVIVQSGFNAPVQMSTADSWVCMIAFALQIYFDFSGYTDIGRGSAMLIGFRLPDNFDLPYIARSLREFWHRWHISLSTWLRDYLYIPLGGSRGGELFTKRNLLITMLLGGLWHGASWHYVFWGAFHGLGLALDRTWGNLSARMPAVTALKKTAAWHVFAWAFTFVVVLCGWVLFRAENLQQAWQVYTGMFSLRPSTAETETVINLFLQSTLPYALTLYTVLYAALSCHHRFPQFTSSLAQGLNNALPPAMRRAFASPPLSARVCVWLATSLLILGFASFKSMPFIYFQF